MHAPHSAAAVPVHQLRESYTKGCPLYEFSPVFPFTALLSPQTTRFTALASLDPFLPLSVTQQPGPRLEHGGGRASSPRCRYRPLRARSTAGTKGRRCPACRDPPGGCREPPGGRPAASVPPPPLPPRFPAGAIFWPAQLRAALPAAKWPPCCGAVGVLGMAGLREHTVLHPHLQLVPSAQWASFDVDTRHCGALLVLRSPRIPA